MGAAKKDDIERHRSTQQILKDREPKQVSEARLWLFISLVALAVMVIFWVWG